MFTSLLDAEVSELAGERYARPSVPMMMRHLAWQKLDSKEGEEVS